TGGACWAWETCVREASNALPPPWARARSASSSCTRCWRSDVSEAQSKAENKPGSRAGRRVGNGSLESGEGQDTMQAPNLVPSSEVEVAVSSNPIMVPVTRARRASVRAIVSEQASAAIGAEADDEAPTRLGDLAQGLQFTDPEQLGMGPDRLRFFHLAVQLCPSALPLHVGGEPRLLLLGLDPG